MSDFTTILTNAYDSILNKRKRDITKPKLINNLFSMLILKPITNQTFPETTNVFIQNY